MGIASKSSKTVENHPLIIQNNQRPLSIQDFLEDRPFSSRKAVHLWSFICLVYALWDIHIRVRGRWLKIFWTVQFQSFWSFILTIIDRPLWPKALYLRCGRKWPNTCYRLRPQHFFIKSDWKYFKLSGLILVEWNAFGHNNKTASSKTLHFPDYCGGWNLYKASF